MRLGYLGPAGTFSHQAALEFADGGDWELIPSPSLPDLLRKTYRSELDFSMVPVENSLEGAVNVSLDMLAGETPLYIHSERVLDIDEYLMVRPGVQREEIRCVLSHVQPLGQCAQYLAREFPEIEQRVSASTAQAALDVSQQIDLPWAVLAPRGAAQVYGLEILEGPVQDLSNNRTRFLVLSAQPRKDDPMAQPIRALQESRGTVSKKISIMFSAPNTPGSLYKVLQILDVWGLNMTHIESRPDKESLWKYLFFVDFEGDASDSAVALALQMIRDRSADFRYFGNYEIWEEKDHRFTKGAR